MKFSIAGKTKVGAPMVLADTGEGIRAIFYTNDTGWSQGPGSLQMQVPYFKSKLFELMREADAIVQAKEGQNYAQVANQDFMIRASKSTVHEDNTVCNITLLTTELRGIKFRLTMFNKDNTRNTQFSNVDIVSEWITISRDVFFVHHNEYVHVVRPAGAQEGIPDDYNTNSKWYTTIQDELDLESLVKQASIVAEIQNTLFSQTVSPSFQFMPKEKQCVLRVKKEKGVKTGTMPSESKRFVFSGQVCGRGVIFPGSKDKKSEDAFMDAIKFFSDLRAQQKASEEVSTEPKVHETETAA